MTIVRMAILALAVGAASVAPASTPRGTADTTAVADEGMTRINGGGAGATPASATIVTRHTSEAEGVASRATRCSGGRTVCSLVDRLTIEVGGRKVEVPPRALLELADVDTAALRGLGGGRFELVLTCGDATPAYQARLFFTARRVERLDIWSDEAGMVEQSTTFRDVSKAFR